MHSSLSSLDAQDYYWFASGLLLSQGPCFPVSLVRSFLTVTIGCHLTIYYLSLPLSPSTYRLSLPANWAHSLHTAQVYRAISTREPCLAA
ncbi:hypothetical protein FIBSPDRAFT_869852 [Athelia psychrophila]|uniref:Uncharacterized protein n=1 Tax=Athelia psychrophila TaxID=1759441 RepID=A0A167UAR2_9AGAM|nr:hypothetical protein FIBSPDRAFT_879160 [Fibularhizoctonia sp. CBS 109695]KZP12866.1 hypothetical protein FIBSPDRAFT_869852 [Fibularhizoctonia sp. CBS 109695]